jgi:hypothetical protein
MKAEGVAFNKEVVDPGPIKYIMVPTPDGVLIKF